MAIDFFIKQDDQLPELQATLKDSTNAVVNLSGCSVRFIMRDKSTGETKVDAPATVVNAAGGVVKYSWAVGDTDIPSTYKAEFEVQFPDTRLGTFPNSSYMQVKVTPDLGGVA